MAGMVLHPKALRRGDRVAVVSPAGPIRKSALPNLERGMDRLRALGLRPELSEHALEEHGYLAGSDAGRAADLQRAFADPEIRGILCTRGGYGATRILHLLDFAPLKRDPKPILGYSDITAILAAAFRRIGLLGLHGPMVATSEAFAMGAAMERLQQRLLMDASEAPELPGSALGPRPHVLREGRVEAELVGGNLSLVVALMGTPDEIDCSGRILFLEDIEEAPYRVDRMLTQLRAAGVFERCAGVLLGDFHAEDTPLASEHEPTSEVIRERLADVRCPIVAGLPFGHRPESWTLPVGGTVRIDAEDSSKSPRISIIQAAVR